MKPSRFPKTCSIWAKSAQKHAGSGESLARHTWNVLARLSDLAHLRPDLTTVLGANAQDLWHCLFWGCFLHDFGKAAHGFQVFLQQNIAWGHRHEVLSLAFLDWIAPELSSHQRLWVLVTIVTHHRPADSIAERYDELMDPDPLESLIADVPEPSVRELWHWFATCATSWIHDLDLGRFGVRPLALVEEETAVRLVCQEGVTRTRRWLIDYETLVERLKRPPDPAFVVHHVLLKGLTTTADHLASAHVWRVQGVPQQSWEAFACACLKQPNVDRMYMHQRESAASAHKSALLIAPTGTGKTEAVLFWALGDGSRAVPRLFYTLPYQSSMNAMYDRLSQAHYFGQQHVGLQHGRALQALQERFLEQSERGATSAAQLASWKKQLSILHAHPVKVFSIYQMLKVVYRLNGFEAMLADYTQAAFIFDEIHAYDPQRLASVLCLVNMLRQHYGARFFFLSATFPHLLRNALSEVLEDPICIEADAKIYQTFQRHHLLLLQGDLCAYPLETILDAVNHGQSILICCNTVRRAQKLYRRLRDHLPQERIALLHSRLTMRDRLQRERRIQQRCPRGKHAPEDALVLVATQVVEVSLDIDLDCCYSDPAPLEALIQRFGRVNRACAKGIVPVYVFQEPHNGQHVYNDALVHSTLRLLAQQHDTDINEAHLNSWLDEIYNEPTISNAWKQAYRQQYDLTNNLLRQLRPFTRNEQSEQAFEQLFESVDVLPACLKQEYDQLIDRNDFLNASMLLVSISQKKCRQLYATKKLNEHVYNKQHIRVVEVPYDPELGLLFDKLSDTVPDGD